MPRPSLIEFFGDAICSMEADGDRMERWSGWRRRGNPDVARDPSYTFDPVLTYAEYREANREIRTKVRELNQLLYRYGLTIGPHPWMTIRNSLNRVGRKAKAREATNG